jgi:ATP-dependent Clp protease protease subunit
MPISKRTAKDEVNQLHDYNIRIKTREIYLHPRIDSDDGGVEYGMTTQFVKNLDLLANQNSRNILVRMQSPGGSWPDGVAVYDAIISSTAPVTILAYGYASSMTSVILQAADKRVLMPHTEFMVHFGHISDDNSYLNFVSGSDFLKVTTQRMLKLYAKRCIQGEHFKRRYKAITEEKVMQYIDRVIKERGDWFMTPEEAVYFGMADGILGEQGFETIEKIRTNKKWVSS